MDAIFKALADPTRRKLLDSLNARNGQTLSELCSQTAIARQSVAKHLAILEAANLVTTVRRGREKLHHLNAVPINDIAERWISHYDRRRARALADLKHALEATPVSRTEFVYVTYIKTTPEKLWQALTEPAFIRRYFEETGPRSDWRPGSPVAWKVSPDGDHLDLGQTVLESEPGRRLSYTWHTYQPEMAEMFGWSQEKLAELQKEKLSTVTFEIEPVAPGPDSDAGSTGTVKLTVTHDDFEPDSEMLQAVSQGWPMILSNLKTLLETEDVLVMPAEM